MQPSPEIVSVPRRPLDVEDYIDIARRNWGWIAGPLLLGLVVGVVVAFLWPDTYLSWATLRIVPPQVPERVIPSNFNRQMAERLDGIVQRVTSRDSLIGIMTRRELFKSERARQPIEDVWTEMKRNIQVAALGSQRESRGLSYVFQISFRYKDRQGTYHALDDIVGKLTSETASERLRASEQTRLFLSDQQKDAAKELRDIEERRASFRTRNVGRLPEEMQANFQALQALQLRLASVNESINRAGQEKLMLETQLQNVKDQIKAVGSTQDESGEAMKNDRLVQLNRLILDGETTLSALRQTYREEHPDIRSIKARLEVLKKERDSLVQQEEQQNTAAADAARKRTNPAVAKSVRELEGTRRNLESRIQANSLDIEERLKAQKRIEEQMKGLQELIQSSPLNERDYNVLMQNYQLARARYDDLTLKLKQSEMADQVEVLSQAERLEVLEPAFVPQKPVEPNRWFIVGAGVGFGLMLGVLLTGLREAKDASLKSLKDVRAYANAQVLASVPLLEDAVVVRRKRRLVWLAWSTAMIVAVLVMSSTMYYYFFVGQRSGTGS